MMGPWALPRSSILVCCCHAGRLRWAHASREWLIAMRDAIEVSLRNQTTVISAAWSASRSAWSCAMTASLLRCSSIVARFSPPS